jgi:2-amino-1-hydroxyethylphosphonate dioxygenase (glycine-forming)
MKHNEAEIVANEIIDLYSIYGGDEYAGEKVTQLEHMVQAAQLARVQGYDDEVVLAAFLHDIGHIAEKSTADNAMEGFGIREIWVVTRPLR